MRLRLENIPQPLQGALGVKDTETVTFARLDGELFQDGVRFANGAQVTLQRLGPGVKAAVEDALKAPRRERMTEFAT
jgi:hypothetical protein